MKKMFVATLGLALLSGTVVFAQNTAAGSTDTMNGTMSGKKHKKSKKSKGSTASDTAGTASSTK